MDEPRDSQITSAPTLPGPQQRDAVDAFCRAHRAWALRQARRNYRHLPESLREEAVDLALSGLRVRVPASTEHRALSAELAERLTAALRQVHVGWCLNESSALLRREDTEPVAPEVRRTELARFVESGLGGLERAVLQLEIGAGRDSRTSRAALRLPPRAYARHRSSGLSKLRDAISAAVVGRACDQHVAGVVDAAMGDQQAMDALATGSRRCRFCAREAQGLRRVLHERLAVAPWPLAITPAGALAAKLGAASAVVGGKAAGVGTGAGLGAAAGSGSGASMAATVLAAAALATGTAALTGSDATPRERGAGREAAKARVASAAAPRSRAAVTTARATRESGAARHAARATRRHAARKRRHGSSAGGGGPAPASSPSVPSSGASSPGTTTVAAANTPASGAPKPAATAAPAPSKGPVSSATEPVTHAVGTAVEQVAGAVPTAVPAPVKSTVDTVTGAVDQTTSAVDGLLEP